MLDDYEDYVIIDSVINLAKSFNRQVIAEGVETTEHGMLLLTMGCKDAQGYEIARPMPALDFVAWLASYKPNEKWLSCAKNIATKKERKRQLLRLTLTQWKNYFIASIQSLPSDTKQWPVLKRTKCHCGVWLKRFRQENIFSEESLNRLNKGHNNLHDIIDNLY